MQKYIRCLREEEIDFAKKNSQLHRQWKINFFYDALEDILSQASVRLSGENWRVLSLQEGKELIDYTIDKLKKIKKKANEEEGKEKCVVLSTVHKAKGKEADRVFVLNPRQFSGGSSQERLVEQERNMVYVALTRAKKEMYFVQDNAQTDVFDSNMLLPFPPPPPTSSPNPSPTPSPTPSGHNMRIQRPFFLGFVRLSPGECCSVSFWKILADCGISFPPFSV